MKYTELEKRKEQERATASAASEKEKHPGYLAWKERRAKQERDKDEPSAYETYKARREARQAQKQLKATKMVNMLLGEVRRTSNAYKKRYQDETQKYRSDASEWLETVNQGRDASREMAAELSRYLNENRAFLGDDFVSQATKAVTDGRKFQRYAAEQAQRELDYFSQWESEDAYNREMEEVQARIREQEALRNYDVEAGKKEIEDLERRVQDRNRKTQGPASGYLTGGSMDTSSAYGAARQQEEIGDDESKELHREISRKKQYLTQAQRLQEREALAAVTSNDDFRQLSAGLEAIQDVQYRYINDEEYRRQYQQLIGDEYDNLHEGGLDILTEEEKNIYNYHYAKDGKEKAQEYLNSIREQLNYRRAAERFETYDDHTLLEMAFGVEAGIDQFQSGMRSALWNSEGDYVAPSSRQMLSGMVREDLGEKSGFAQGAYDVVTTTANMAPSILTSTIANILAPGSGAYIGGAMMGMSSGGSAYQEMLNRGYSKEQSRTYGMLVGASEAVLGELLGGISKLGGKLSGKVLTGILDKVDNVFLRTIGKIGGSMISEGGEEMLQEVLTPWFESILTGEEYQVQSEDVWCAGLLGALSGGLLEGPTTISGEYSTYRQGVELQEAGIKADRLKAIGQTFAADTVAYRLAGRVDGNTDAYTLGRLFNEIDAELTQQNEDSIVSSLVSKGVRQRDAKKMAKGFGAVISGTQLTQQQVDAIAMNPVLAETVREVIIDPNSTVNQRNQGFRDVLRQMSEGGAAVEAAENSEAEPVPAEENTGVQARIEAGQARLISTEENVNVRQVSRIRDGRMELELEDGRVVDAEDVVFGSEGEAVIYSTLAEMGVHPAEANVLMENYRLENTDAEYYANGIQEAYRFGQLHYPAEQAAQGPFSSMLTRRQMQSAYELGWNSGRAKTVQAAAAAKNAKVQNAGPGRVHFAGDRNVLTTRQQVSLKALDMISSALGVQIHVFESQVGADGKRIGANGWFDSRDNSIHIDLYAGEQAADTMLFTASHELTHFVKKWSPEKFRILSEFLMDEYGRADVDVETLVQNQIQLAAKNNRMLSYDEAFEEVIADSMETLLADGDVVAKLEKLKTKDRSLWEHIRDFVMDLAGKIRKVYEGLKADSEEGRHVAEMADAMDRLKELFTEGLSDAGTNYQAAMERGGVEYDADTESVAPVMFSERTWTESEYVKDREAAAEAISKQLGVSIGKAKQYIDDIHSVARLIADDRVRLDYEPNLDTHATVLKPNSEYKYTVDMSTLCAKRLLFTGTFDAIQRALPDTAFDSDDVVKIRKMMMDRNMEVACGICYVESTRREIGRITQEFIERYKVAQKTGKPISRINSSGKEVTLSAKGRTFMADPEYTPNLGELNTTDIDIVKMDHREVYDAYIAFMNARGQAKPKLLETRAEYKGEILKHFKAKSAVNSRNAHGGLRLQSFSDFEVPHMIDMMQVVMDMSRVGLKSQAYTKVPAFAEVFGGTGVKINLSLIAKGSGVDANGNLVFDDVEGINHEEAFRLRDQYSENVGTILVGKNNAHIIAAMADPRIDFIIPFHKSSWKESLYEALGLTGYDDYTESQNEKPIDKTRKIENFDPSEYWDFSKTGDENAQIYLQKCREDGRIPKFSDFQGYPGYWKLLIDFKMYNNDGVGSPQNVVRPEFNMEAAARILNEYKGGHRSFPVAQGIVDEFVQEYKDNHPGIMYSERREEAVSDRALLANAFESVAKTDLERKKIREYQKKIKELDAQEQKLRQLRSQIQELTAAKGDKKQIQTLRDEAIKTTNRINIADSQLLRLEGSAALKSVLEREKAKAYERGRQRGKEAVEAYREKAEARQNEARMEYREKAASIRGDLRETQQSLKLMEKEFIRIARAYEKDAQRAQRQQANGEERIAGLKAALKEETRNHRQDQALWEKEFNRLLREYETAGRSIERMEATIARQRERAREKVESRRRTEMRHKVQKVAKELNDLLNSESKKRHVPDSMKKAVAEALVTVNMNTYDSDAKIAKYKALIEKTTDPDKIQAYQDAIIAEQDKAQNIAARMEALRQSYDDIRQSDDPDIANGYDDVVAGNLKELSESIKDTPLGKMSIEQMEDMYSMFKMVLIRVRDANKLLVEGRTGNIREQASKVVQEIQASGGEKEFRVSALDGVKKFFWNNLKPIYAMEKLGSKVFTGAFMELIRGEGVYGLDIKEATEFAQVQKNKHGYQKWDMKKKHSFTSASGLKFELTLEQILSLYAYSKREQSLEHLRLGGFVFDSNIKTYKEKDGKKSVIKYKINTAKAHQLTADILAEIVDTLSAEQRAFVDEMQAYLSDTMGAKGNEVTSNLYGIKLFKEKFYFPLRSSKEYMHRKEQETNAQVKIKNSGFTNQVKPHANNPVILSNFMDVWAEHVHDMSMYHAFTLPLEDFSRIFGYQSPKAEGVAPVSVQGTIQNAYGPEAVSYVNNLINDLNGGARSDPRESTAKQMMGLFKKAAVMGSLSVVIQQPSALIRAQALVNAKYFLGRKVDKKRNKELWEEVKQIAPVALLKEMGHFDMDTGRSTVEYIKGEKTLMQKADDLLAIAPAKADEWAWVQIWDAVKRETIDRHPGLMSRDRKAFMKIAGERFTEVIVKTQVYDSTLSRSANMRSKSALMSMATAFMAEPTTSINMLENGFRALKKGYKKQAAKQFGAVYGSMIANSILVSLVYAMRDDDENETFTEKYFSSLAAELVDGFNPITYYPWLKDGWSLLQGHKVERSDMSVLSDVVDALDSFGKLVATDTSDMDEEELAEHQQKQVERAWTLTDSVASLLGIPLKNVRRDIMAVVNTVKTLSNGLVDNPTSFWEKIDEAVRDTLPFSKWAGSESRSNRLFRAITNGDTEYRTRVEAEYDSETALTTAIRKGLRENDSRIQEAARAFYDEEYERYNELFEEIRGEGNFVHNDIYAAIQAEVNELEKADESENAEKAEAEDRALYNAESYFRALEAGKTESAKLAYDVLYEAEIDEGYLPMEAESNVKSSLATQIGNAYKNGEITRDQALDLLTEYTDKGETDVKKWDFELEYGYTWGSRDRAYRKGAISEADLIRAIVDIEGENREEAEGYIRFLELEMANTDLEITTALANSYFEHAEPAKIGLDIYMDFQSKLDLCVSDKDEYGKTISGSKKEKVMKMIDGLKLTDDQKDALYYAAGYKESTIDDAPWRKRRK